jgi:hypothetical protein
VAGAVEHAHAETERAARHRLADAPHADDAERLAVHVGAAQQVDIPARASWPLRRNRSAVGRRRAVASSSAHVRSAVASVSTPGVLVTTMPRAVRRRDVDVVGGPRRSG